jgi:predicted metal-dependent peptidase
LKIKVFNIAADCSVNVQANIRDPIIIDSKPWPPMLPAMFDLEEGKITEDYYLELLKRAEKAKKEIEKMMEQFEKSDAFSSHKDWTDGINGVADLNSLSRKLDQHLQTIIRESVKGFNKDRSSLPAHISQLIQDALEPPKAPYEFTGVVLALTLELVKELFILITPPLPIENIPKKLYAKVIFKGS